MRKALPSVVLPLPSWLRHCLSVALPPPSFSKTVPHHAVGLRSAFTANIAQYLYGGEGGKAGREAVDDDADQFTVAATQLSWLPMMMAVVFFFEMMVSAPSRPAFAALPFS